MVNHFWQSVETIFNKVLTPFLKTFPWLKQLFDAKQLIQRLSSFSVPKLRLSDTCNQVQSCSPKVCNLKENNWFLIDNTLNIAIEHNVEIAPLSTQRCKLCYVSGVAMKNKQTKVSA